MGMVFLSEKVCGPLLEDLKQKGHEIFIVKKTDLVYDAIADHPDIYMCRIGDTLVIDDAVRTEPDIREIYDLEMQVKLGDPTAAPLIPALHSQSGGQIIFQTGGIGHEYPFDVPYNAVSTGAFFIHNLDCTSPSLLDRAREAGLEFIDVKQGYTKCSCVVVSDRAVITSDRGIIRTIAAYNEMLADEGEGEEKIDCLEIEEGSVSLPGLNHGFLGGASGLIDGTLYFNGDLTEHPDFEKIREFISSHGVETVWYEGCELTDIGSVICLD